jgi:hypothetical protein
MMSLRYTTRITLTPSVTVLLGLAAAIDVVLGLLFYFSPELRLNLWPSAIAPLLARFIGAIVLANGVGLFFALRLQSWESLRALFVVGMVYGLLALFALLYHLLFKNAPDVFWLYTVLDSLYTTSIFFIFRHYEKARA